jgi:hypothetical protein
MDDRKRLLQPRDRAPTGTAFGAHGMMLRENGARSRVSRARLAQLCCPHLHSVNLFEPALGDSAGRQSRVLWELFHP